MCVKTIGPAILASLLASSPAAASDSASRHFQGDPAIARTLSSVSVGRRVFDVTAMPRGMRADTPLAWARIDESRALNKVMPGYPQPAFVTFGLRMSF